MAPVMKPGAVVEPEHRSRNRQRAVVDTAVLVVRVIPIPPMAPRHGTGLLMATSLHLIGWAAAVECEVMM
jgi:hypothetical protein